MRVLGVFFGWVDSAVGVFKCTAAALESSLRNVDVVLGVFLRLPKRAAFYNHEL